MTTPADPDNETSAEAVDLGKRAAPAEEPFDPYRFGKPDHPIPAEYAPPGYTGPVIPAASPAGESPYGQGGNPFANPPGTPYGPPPPYGYPPAGYGPYSPYGPYGAGAPTPPPYSSYAQPARRSGKAVAALVLGILSIPFAVLTFFDAVFVVLGLVFSLLALSETKSPWVGGRGMAVAGLVCTIVGAALATLLTAVIVHAMNQCGGFSHSNDPGWKTCVQSHV